MAYTGAKKMVDFLYQLIGVIQEDYLTDTTTEFQLSALTFFNDSFDDKVEATTWELLNMANTFLTE